MGSSLDELLLFSKIKAVRNNLSKKERKLADYILEHPEALSNSTALSLAEESDISSATVIRFCRSCGFSGLAELKLYFNREILTENSQGNQINQLDSVFVIKQKVQSYHESVLRNIVATADEKCYEAAADAIIRAGKVLLSGVGGSQVAANTIMDTFLGLGVPCEYYVDPVTATYKTNLLQPGDVLFVIMYTGSFTTLVSDMKAAQEKGVTVILLNGITGSPSEKYADIILYSSVVPQEFATSAISIRVAELIMIEVLYALCEHKLSQQGRQKIDLDRSLNVHRLPGKWPIKD